MNTPETPSDLEAFPQKLYLELSTRFPEIRGRIQADADEPYALMNHLAEWIMEMNNHAEPLIARLAQFAEWCESQPSGEGPSEDPLTILVIGFYEALFESPATQELLPKLASRKTLVENADYFRAWIGDDNYRRAIGL